MATQGSYGFQGFHYFVHFLSDASESFLPSPEGGFVIEYIDYSRVASNDLSLLLFFSPYLLPSLTHVLAFLSLSFFFFFSYKHLFNYKEKVSEATVLAFWKPFAR